MAIDIWSILRKKYPEKEYALMKEVSDAAGFSRSRSADYVVVNLWPSRGLSISGIELKSFRSDWLNELKKPDKAENIFRYCDHFWLLTSDDTIARIEEIPPTWGWMYIKAGRICIKKDAPKLTPINVSRDFICAMLKRAQDKTSFVHIDSIQERIDMEKEFVKTANRRHVDHIEKELKELNSILKEFQDASGIDLRHFSRWKTSPRKIGEAVKFIENGDVEPIRKELASLQQIASNILEKINVASEVLGINYKEHI